MDYYYKPDELGKLLQIGYKKVLNLIHTKKLTHYKIGGEYRISELDLDEYLKSCKVKGNGNKDNASK